MIDLKQFRENAIARNLCGKYADMWSDDKSKRQLFEIACDTNGAEYMAQSLSEGWGLSTDFIEEKFKPYINGKYICKYRNSKGNGYDSLMLCKYDEKKFNVNTTLLCVLDSNTELHIASNHFCRIYVAGTSYIHVELGNDSGCEIIVYGGEPMITGNVDNSRVRIKRIMKGGNNNG